MEDDISAEQQHEITRDDDTGRYVLEGDPDAAYLEFQRSDERLVLTHTEVDEGLEGQGIGSTLVRTALSDAEEQDLTVVPECRFVAGWLDRHPERAEELEIAS